MRLPTRTERFPNHPDHLPILSEQVFTLSERVPRLGEECPTLQFALGMCSVSSVRSGIFVEDRAETRASPVGAEYAAPDGAGISFWSWAYKDAALLGLAEHALVLQPAWQMGWTPSGRAVGCGHVIA